ncbi:MAG TPA: DUF3857 and transglutaminase domain-containing protein [Burkholderiales bacterium]|nr:DUF3857 and transglutaminase domain-containing protein [Burkholderiales bacterium]
MPDDPHLSSRVTRDNPPLVIACGVVFSMLCLLGATSPAASAASRIESGSYFLLTDSAPRWIADVPKSSAASTQTARGGFKYELLDWQLDYTGSAPVQYFHAVGLIEESAALGRASSFDAEYNPEYQTLTLHHVSILRAGKTIDKLPGLRVTLARREGRLEQSIYDGIVSANILLDDVRVGDRVSYAYSVTGSNPVFGKHVDETFSLMSYTPIEVLQIRVRAPSSTPVNTRFIGDARGIQVSRSGGVTEYVVRREHVPALVQEEDWPAWYSPAAQVQFSDYGTWGEVSRWAVDLFRISQEPSPDLRQAISRIKAQQKDQETNARLALEFVQNEIGYVSLAIGDGSHRPAQPNEVLARRFGDCKDKTMLLVAMLRALGIQADPVLVSLRELRIISQWLPSPHVFDHAIVRATIDGQVFWIDGTRRYQAGPLARRGITPFGKALVIRPETTELADVSASTQYIAEVTRRQEFVLPRADAPAQLTTESLYSGEAAEGTRAAIAQSGIEAIDKETLYFLTKNFAPMRQDGATTVEDDSTGNTVTIRRRYTVENLFEKRDGLLVGNFSGAYLMPFARIPSSMDRTSPVGLYYPWDEKQIVTIDAPFVRGMRTRPPEVLETPYVSFSRKSEVIGSSLTIEYAYRSRTDAVPASEVAGHASLMREMQRALSTEITAGSGADPAPKANLRLPRPTGRNADQ